MKDSSIINISPFHQKRGRFLFLDKVNSPLTLLLIACLKLFINHTVKLMLISIFHSGSLKDPEMWIAAASQNAFDTGAGIGALATFAAFMSRQRGAVRYGTIIPMLNNLVR